MALRQKLHLNTSLKHKELTIGGKQIHSKHVNALKEQIHRYGLNPFSNQPPTCVSTGVEIENIVYNDMINA